MKGKKRYLYIVPAVLAVLLVVGCGPSRTSKPRLRIELTSPKTRTTLAEPTVTITGIVSEPGVRTTIDDEEIAVDSEGAFSSEVPLEYGSNRIVVKAEDDDFLSSTRTLTITRELALNLDSPAEPEFMTNARRLQVSGLVSDPAAKVFVAGTEVPVDQETGRFSMDLDLHYLLTIIPVSALVDGVEEPVTQQLHVSYDDGTTSS
ncbi:MAG: hypothetical protein ACQETQ_07525 [Spirochaetota bacterium]